MSFAVRIWLSILLLAMSGYTAYSGWRLYSMASAAEPSAVEDPEFNSSPASASTIRDVENLKFTTSENESLELKQLNGKVWIGSFFFSSCPGPCRQINMAIAELAKELSDKDVSFVSMTVDPDNDTPQVLHNYGQGFGADFSRWHFLTGNFDDVRRVCQDVFAMPIDRKVHTERLILVDRAGRRRGIFSTGDPAQMTALRRTIGQLLDEKPVASDKSAASGSAVGTAPITGAAGGSGGHVEHAHGGRGHGTQNEVAGESAAGESAASGTTAGSQDAS